MLDLIDKVNFITNKKTKKFIVDVSSEALERYITTLYRETNKEEKETGSYNLYIAYPFVEGVFKKDAFAIKAPLLYFPVKLVRNNRKFTVVKDKDKDIKYNRDLKIRQLLN